MQQRSKVTDITSFIERSRIVHGNVYDYSKSIYRYSKAKLLIICPTHGGFEQTPSDHIKGRGCPACAGKKPLTKEDFIEKAERVHGQKYDYSKVKMRGNRVHIIIRCPIHGAFMQRPCNHLYGYGCESCSRNLKGRGRQKKLRFNE